MKYDSLEYARSRLTGSWVLHHSAEGKKLVNVVGVDRHGRDNFFIIANDIKGHASNGLYDEFDVTPLLLGNVNAVNTSIYLSRLPLRNDWKQGLRSRNLKLPTEVQVLQRGEPTELYLSVEKELINGGYPPLYECQERVEDLFTSAAFSRRFAVDEKGRLIYKNGKVVGTCEDEPRLDNAHTYLAECLEEDMRDVEV